ncbi:GDP-mannose mannosyl hydrolase [Moritella viscosa]|uniref:GDP-mannose mannosyl hydrolase n=1 Tax=Moritella viscosa TaxID=80854 RepID=A0A1K9Z2Q9_9GAMM|nr:GDP-mannose mannosyl hydrolase [Moritella viscosa]SGY98630.1 GDP-mannose mannosyl hydrolase [Moritella viscosa]SGY99132.1 GDP-mannose mannosyl hydrolase [Moritella viscosa]SHO05382.1 GDP-mannose mannosyl hydrolase [Moritella viscosa]SHO05383.1 GDP-mannose mannosyl hydrolase [Moritella viscosa]
MFLDNNTFETVIDSTPLISIDLVVKTHRIKHYSGLEPIDPRRVIGLYLVVAFKKMNRCKLHSHDFVSMNSD